MQRFIPYEKLSKKQKREYNKEYREMRTINPITRKTINVKIYNRKKSHRWMDDRQHGGIFISA